MREIKFRAWNKSARAMLEWGYLRVCGQHLLFVDSLTWMQFTGLIDKNGKEIYEGDIVEQYAESEWSLRYEIQWRDDHCGFWMNTQGKPHLDLNHYREKLTVVGNIYENPELVGGT
jgi:uncharacterized phage protein (TIGR01671 family)